MESLPTAGRLTPEIIEQLKVDLKTAKTYEDLMGKNGAIKKIIKASLEGMLDAEIIEPLIMKNTHLPAKTPITAVTAKPTRP